MCGIWYVFILFSKCLIILIFVVFFSGIVRNVNISTGDIYVITPVSPDLLNCVNHFKFWTHKYLPSTFFSVGTTVSKYCNVKQDNIFNENVSRHYKIML